MIFSAAAKSENINHSGERETKGGDKGCKPSRVAKHYTVLFKHNLQIVATSTCTNLTSFILKSDILKWLRIIALISSYALDYIEIK